MLVTCAHGVKIMRHWRNKKEMSTEKNYVLAERLHVCAVNIVAKIIRVTTL